MRCLDFGDNPSICILIKSSYFDELKLLDNYVKPMQSHNVLDIMACELPYPTSKMTVGNCRKEITKLLPSLVNYGIRYLYVADATYFKALTGQIQTDKHLGYVLPCKIKGFEHLYVVLGINYGQLLYNPNLDSKLDMSLNTLISHYKGEYVTRGDIIQSASYPSNTSDIERELANLHQYPVLTCDIETTGLAIGSELYSIAFAYNQHEGIAFKVLDKRQLKLFFERYRGTLVFHNATFDIKHIIFNCFMSHPRDHQGMLHGLHTMCKNVHDTKIIAYLSLNSTTGNELSLKDLSHEFVGNYAIDVKDVTRHPINIVLEYNLKDTLATFYVFNKYYPRMLKDNQEGIYKSIMLPSIKTLVQIELHGMPMNMDKVIESKAHLQSIVDANLAKIHNNPHVKDCLLDLKLIELDKVNQKLKTKQHTIDKFVDMQFNPNSNAHLAKLLYEDLQLPVLDYTTSKQPAVGAKTLKKLKNHTNSPLILELLDALLAYSSAQKVITTFIPAFEQAMPKDGWHYLHGNFNLAGTVSNRLSSSNPNLQNLPSGSEFGKLVKQCFSAPDDWLFVGSDFNALEDRINALITKDEAKLKIYTDGFDGHSLRAFYYWRDKMPDIVETVESINSISKKYPELRQKSKAPSFALAYQGTWQTLVNNSGFTEQEAKQIEENYHKLYYQSDAWVADRLKECEQQGYIDVAFGLRIRTPIVGRTVLNSSKTPHIATAEARSVANAASGQSYCQLTNRAANEFMERVWASEYKYDIMPVCLIHDAIYLMVRNDVKIIKWVNDNLIDCMAWQELPELQHDTVKLEAELDIYYPTWADSITLPNNISEDEILSTC
ncbi:DNA polymerase [Moraxella sp. ZY200743]|uniref:DNA polymerase n=1 Tax=Moraxella sp. ZY200743 TaxID=2911970 RepID=UPI003D7EE7B7